MSFLKVINNENALVLNTPKRCELLSQGPPRNLKRQILGRGAFGTVFKAIYHDRPVAVKIIKNEKSVSTLHNEAHALPLKHHNIVRLLKVESTPDFGLIIMERSMDICLQRVLDTLPLPLMHRLLITLDILAALCFCHSQFLLHLDVKPANILVELGNKPFNEVGSHFRRTYVCKLCDFGSSIRLNELCAVDKGAKGTLRYMSPEALCSAPLSYASDIYSLGITMWEMQTRLLPYYNVACNESIAYLVVKHGLRPDQAKLECTSENVKASPHCYCIKHDSCIDSKRVRRNFNNTACRSLNFESKRILKDPMTSIGGYRKHRRLAPYFHDSLPSTIVGYLENGYTALYRSCWHSNPKLRLNDLQLQLKLERYLAECFLSM